MEFGGPPPSRILEMEREYPQLMRRRFETELVPHARGVPITLEIVSHADYSRGITDYAGAHHAHAVVLGTTGRSGLGYALLGTTAERVMRDVGTAVLAIKHRD